MSSDLGQIFDTKNVHVKIEPLSIQMDKTVRLLQLSYIIISQNSQSKNDDKVQVKEGKPLNQ